MEIKMLNSPSTPTSPNADSAPSTVDGPIDLDEPPTPLAAGGIIDSPNLGIELDKPEAFVAASGRVVGSTHQGEQVEEPRRLAEEWRPWCCPEPRCIPLHTVQGESEPLSVASPGESFICFGKAPLIEYVYDGHAHANDTRSCHFTPNKGLIAYQENANDWQAIGGAYSRAFLALKRFEAQA